MIQDLIDSSRLKARTILQESMPASITRLQALIEQEQDSSSPLWIGRIEEGVYVADNLRLYQPGQAVPGTVPQIVRPTDIKGIMSQGGLEEVAGLEKTVVEDMQDGMISRGSGEGIVELKESTSTTNELVGVDMKQKVGVHWFEIMPRNTNQEEVIKLVRA
jgi:hypothetical protein